MKKNSTLLLLAVMALALLLQSCGVYNSMSNEEKFKTGYNTGVWLRGGNDYMRLAPCVCSA